MRGLRYLLGIHRVDTMKEVVHVMVKHADNGNPSCEKERGNRCKQETFLS